MSAVSSLLAIALQMRGLRKRYGDQEVVCGIDLTIAAGECFGLLGPNGAGKTTTLKLCLGLIDPDEGDANLLGYEVQVGVAAIPVLVLTGLAFAALGLAVNALANGYDFFSYYLTLVLTPMMMLSGVFFPVEQLPGPIQLAAAVLPLHHAVQLVRPLLSGTAPAAPLLHAGVLAGYAALGFYVATVLTRRRLAA